MTDQATPAGKLSARDKLNVSRRCNNPLSPSLPLAKYGEHLKLVQSSPLPRGIGKVSINQSSIHPSIHRFHRMREPGGGPRFFLRCRPGSSVRITSIPNNCYLARIGSSCHRYWDDSPSTKNEQMISLAMTIGSVVNLGIGGTIANENATAYHRGSNDVLIRGRPGETPMIL
ncbi:uncharacterized protein BO66DRAFT_50751 [Aspergillus aculeatinus CBS 121060]|uniref:Uncharacterized protein n=1 Tax=Aspergillus aculeatinus CBS 121060 TaxID=1448322 RepID=A0ACD1HD98_9EURO|nr:hypothetical protein BO66DRAFT_50751 [Aspergillus aculeatinus CBS 121060]RAH71494.1 hypothetical protein BO66DRAFT_50751 [Aspergillus aculeatinus CBS 121060]